MKRISWLAFVAVVGCAAPRQTTEPTPAVQVQRFDASTLAEITHGRVVVMDFWATWCKPCRDGLPKLERLAEAYARDGVVVVGVHVGGAVPEVQQFANEAGIPYAVLVDEDFAFSRQLAAQEVPTVVLFDANGREIVRRHELDAELLGRLDAVIDE